MIEHPDVYVHLLSRRESLVFQKTVDELFPEIEDLPEAEAVDRMYEEGRSLRPKMPELNSCLEVHSTHSAWKVMIVRTQPPKQEEIGRTPERYLAPHENPLLKPDLYRGLILGMAGWYGYGYTSQQFGVIHNNIISAVESYGVIGISANPLNELGLHTEDASYNLGPGLNISPDFLTLHFLRNLDHVPTIVSLADWSRLSTKSRDILHTDFYFNQTNPGQGGSANNATAPVSVLYGDDLNDPWMRINTAKMDLSAYSEEQAEALREFAQLLNDCAVDLALTGGDIALIDNRRAPHGRRQYTKDQLPKFDGFDRWQRRLTTVDDPGRLKEFEVSPRIVDPSLMLTKAAQAAGG